MQTVPLTKAKTLSKKKAQVAGHLLCYTLKGTMNAHHYSKFAMYTCMLDRLVHPNIATSTTNTNYTAYATITTNITNQHTPHYSLYLAMLPMTSLACSRLPEPRSQRGDSGTSHQRASRTGQMSLQSMEMSSTLHYSIKQYTVGQPRIHKVYQTCL